MCRAVRIMAVDMRREPCLTHAEWADLSADEGGDDRLARLTMTRHFAHLGGQNAVAVSAFREVWRSGWALMAGVVPADHPAIFLFILPRDSAGISAELNSSVQGLIADIQAVSDRRAERIIVGSYLPPSQYMKALIVSACEVGCIIALTKPLLFGPAGRDRFYFAEWRGGSGALWTVRPGIGTYRPAVPMPGEWEVKDTCCAEIGISWSESRDQLTLYLAAYLIAAPM